MLIAALIAALGYLGLSSGSEQVSVPDGAAAGDLDLHSCQYDTEKGAQAADCGTLVVPENRSDPRSRLIAVPVIRVRARSQHPGAPIFRLEGGPGISNLVFPQASRFTDDHDVVLVGYRGVEGSSVLDCPEVESVLERSSDILGTASQRAYATAFRKCAARLTHEGVDLDGYGLTAQVEDMEATRTALGYDRIDLVSESAGTRTAMIYGWRHPERIDRSVMIAANPPGNYLWDPKYTDQQVQRYAQLCADDAECRRRTDDLTATMREVARDLPDHWMFLPIKDGQARVLSFYGLFETTTEMAPGNAPRTIDAWLAAADGDASGVWFASLLGDLVIPQGFVWGQHASIGIQDARAVEAFYGAGGDGGSVLESAGSDFVWAGGLMADAWPANPDDAEYDHVRPSDVETLVISGELDFAVPPQLATEQLLPSLANGHQVVLRGFGHSGSIWHDQPGAGTHLIETFLNSGQVDASHYRHQPIDFTPDGSNPTIAKIILGVMLGLALITIVSSAWIAVRLRRRGRFGKISGAFLRSVLAIVNAIGGWMLGALLVLTFLPSVSLGSELLAVVAVGVPVGLVVSIAWTDRDRSRRVRREGHALAMTGALIGAVAGFHAAPGLLALLTTVAGSVAVANLGVIVVDIVRSAPPSQGADPRGNVTPSAIVEEPTVDSSTPDPTLLGAGVR